MHEVKLAVLEVADSAVNEARRSTRRAAGEIIPLYESYTEAAHRRIAGDAATGDAATNHEQVEHTIG
jgi:hypothetical protein